MAKKKAVAVKPEALTGPSITGVDLVGKTVVLREAYFAPAYRNVDRRFVCNGGFGCSPTKMGRAVFGTFLADGEEARIDRGDILCLAPEETEPATAPAVCAAH